MGLVDFVRFVGKHVTKLTLGQLRDQFLAVHEAGREASTQLTTAIHFRHLAKAFSESVVLSSLTQSDLQRYIHDRGDISDHDPQGNHSGRVCGPESIGSATR